MNKLWASKRQERPEVYGLLEKIESEVRKGCEREETREEQKEVAQKTSNMQIHIYKDGDSGVRRLRAEMTDRGISTFL